MITITFEEWKTGTELGILHRRSQEMQAIDQALRLYHQSRDRDRQFMELKAAFDTWIRAQQRAGKKWSDSARNNKGGLVTQLHTQIYMEDARRQVKLMSDPKELEMRRELVKAEKQALKRLFAGRKLVFKYDGKKHKVDRALNVVGLPAASAGVAVPGAIRQAKGDAVVAITPKDVGDFLTNQLAGTAPDAALAMLGTSFRQFCAGASTILSSALAPAKLMIDLALLAKTGIERAEIGGSYAVFKAGQSTAALDAVVRLIDREMQLLAIDMGKQAAVIVAHSFAVGPAASAANAIVDVLVNIRLYARLAHEVERANRLLMTERFSIDLFSVSPLLGCYFLVLADTSVWINVSSADIGAPGWMDAVEKMRKKAEVVRDKAREFIRMSKLAVSGTERMNGLEWEASWATQKIEYIAQLTNFDYIGDKVHKRFAKDSGKTEKSKVDLSRIQGVSSGQVSVPA